jgi:uncharacterized membrane protein YvlD (DUF360 family)
MKIIKSLIVNVIVSWGLLFLFSEVLWWWEGFGIKILFENSDGSIIKIILVFLMLWLVFRVFNSPIKWILKVLSCPVNFMTFGLVSLVINVWIFYLFQYVVNTYSNWQVTVELKNILTTLILSFIMAICTSILTKLLK